MTEQLKHEQTARLDILKAAKSLFAKKGFEGVSVREIAKESGQNISMISYYFGGKEGLYKEILVAHMQSIGSAVHKLIKSQTNKDMTPKSFKADLRSLVSIVLNMKYENPEMMSIMQRERVDGLPFARDLHEKSIGPIANQMIEVFKEAQKKKIIRSGFEPGVFLGVLFESVIGYTISYECSLRALKGNLDLPKEKEKFIDFITDLFSEGIMK